MKEIILPSLIFLSVSSYGQSVISSVNSGANSNNNVVYSVGEIFVNPIANDNDANAGLMGVLSRVEFLVTGLNVHLIADDTRVYPNPTKNSVFFATSGNSSFQQIFVYDMSGQIVLQATNMNRFVDLSGLPDGMYLILTDNQNIKSFKIIKQSL